MKLEKATLNSLDGDNYSFTFMYNPTSISIDYKVNVSENSGARTEDEGIPKVSFAYPIATVISISDIIFDTYEDSSNRDVGNKLNKLTQAVKFIQGKERPPVYIFAWGSINYLRCYVESINYQLTMFLADGTPVRAKASITMKQVDPYKSLSNPPPINCRGADSRW